MRPNKVRTVAKERFSYPLRPRFARSGKRDLPQSGISDVIAYNGGAWIP